MLAKVYKKVMRLVKQSYRWHDDCLNSTASYPFHLMLCVCFVIKMAPALGFLLEHIMTTSLVRNIKHSLKYSTHSTFLIFCFLASNGRSEDD